MKRELITGSRKKLHVYGNKYEQKLRMPELNLDVLNIMTKRDQKRQQAEATKLRMHRQNLPVTDQKQKKLLEYLDSENSVEQDDQLSQNKALEDQRSELNAFLLDKMLINKLEVLGIKLSVSELNRGEICSQISMMAREIISSFDSFKIMAKNNFKFDFDRFLMKYD